MAASFLLDNKRNRGLAYDQSAATDKFTLCNQRDCIFLYFGVLVDVRINFQFMLLGVGFLDEEYTHGSYYKQYTGKHYHVELMLTAKQSEHGTSKGCGYNLVLLRVLTLYRYAGGTR